ncbi:ribonuclease Oy [Stomoxys calcitrans]|uniref:ribonuclease Oy n=1 Tax=Stomoxys calcitrans TaxID=35570 RepID=UPI0027E21896|nr:ribonuclease Oy [Stomoxys calcitrans]
MQIRFCEISTILWVISPIATVLSLSLTSDEISSELIRNEDNLKRIEDIKHNIFFSDELSSSEYHDDLDMEMGIDGNYEWDLLIFTQQWPVTTCYHWREEDKNHACKLPADKEFWTVHGLWPTKKGHFGPSFCNKTAKFDIHLLDEIKDRLNHFWPDIDGESKGDWLWKHEWLKHGTCAAELEELDNELKYFSQGITWREGFELSKMLDSAGIHPDSNNTVVAIHTALLNGLGKNPSIHCLYDSKTDISYLEEIRICFDKELNATDCDGVKHGDAVSIDYPGGTVITNCHISKPVHYPSLVPNKRRQAEKKWKFPIVNLYKLLQFIMWFTL